MLKIEYLIRLENRVGGMDGRHVFMEREHGSFS